MHCEGGVCPGGGRLPRWVSARRGCAYGGVYPRGVSQHALGRGVSSQGGCLCRGVCVCLPGVGWTPPLVNRMTGVTRLHSSKICTTHSSSHQLGEGSVSVHAGMHPPGCGPGDPPGVAWRPHPPQDPSNSPLGVDMETPPARPLNFPPGCGPRDPLPARSLKLPPGCGPGDQEGMLGCHPPETCKACWDTPPVNRITDTCKNITLPQLRFRR